MGTTDARVAAAEDTNAVAGEIDLARLSTFNDHSLSIQLVALNTQRQSQNNMLLDDWGSKPSVNEERGYDRKFGRFFILSDYAWLVLEDQPHLQALSTAIPLK